MACCWCDEGETHDTTKMEYYKLFLKEYVKAVREYERVKTTFRDVAWYNFETVAKGWKGPWAPTVPLSFIKLEASVYHTYTTSRGVRESGRFPAYYEGATFFVLFYLRTPL